MIGSISSNTMLAQMTDNSSSNSNSISSSQLKTISSVLENYDANSLSQADAQAIVEAFEEAGITPGAELASAMSDAGFDAKEVGDLAGVSGGAQGGMPPPPPPSEEEVNSISTLLDTLLNTEDDESSTTSFEDIMDYTSRILNLNEESKTEVTEMLEEYSINPEYSQEVLKTSLSQILSDSNNYKSVSFYA